jgi:MtrB/PioB family decaheme-associated outer membrane protein
VTRLTAPAQLALLALAAASGLACTRVQAAEAQGSELDARGLEASREIDERGLSLLVQARRRSPSGLLYPYPFKPPAWSNAVGVDYRGFVEAGYLANADRDEETRFEEHVDWNDGLLLRDFFLDLRGQEAGGYAHLEGGAAGRDDAFYRAEVGRRGWWRLGLFYDALPHVQANDARSLFRGSEHLALPPPLTPGSSSLANIDAALGGLGERQLEIERDREGGSFALRPAARLTLSGHWRRERRQGERPFGGAIFFSFLNPNNGSVIETVEPIDSLTDDFGIGLQYGGTRVQLDLRYRGSAFENDRRALRWQSPFVLPGLAVSGGQAALAPDNQSHAFKGDLAAALPWSGRFTASAGWNGMSQHERLLPGTINPAFPDWNQANLESLSRRHADARVETFFVDSSLRLRPLRPLTARLHVRYFERDDHTDYLAFNPVAADFGYVAEDGRFGVIPRYAPVPFDHARLIGEASLLWRTPLGANVELEYAQETFDRKQRARDTREERGRLSVVSRRLGPATLRLAYELRDRRGSTYDPAHDRIFYSTGPLDGFAVPQLSTPLSSLREFRQRDLASRVQHELQARLHLALGSSVDLALAGRVRNADHDSDYGLDFERARELSLELGWQASARLELHLFGSVKKRVSRLATIDSDQGVDCTSAPSFFAGGTCFPLANAWSADSDGVTRTAGGGFRASLTRRLEVSGDYSWLRGRDALDYAFASDAALALNTTAAAAGRGLPALRASDQVLRLAAKLQLGERWNARLYYRLEHSGLSDPQQRGLAPRIRRVLYLSHVDRSFTAHVLGAAASLEF